MIFCRNCPSLRCRNGLLACNHILLLSLYLALVRNLHTTNFSMRNILLSCSHKVVFPKGDFEQGLRKAYKKAEL